METNNPFSAPAEGPSHFEREQAQFRLFTELCTRLIRAQEAPSKRVDLGNGLSATYSAGSYPGMGVYQFLVVSNSKQGISLEGGARVDALGISLEEHASGDLKWDAEFFGSHKNVEPVVVQRVLEELDLLTTPLEPYLVQIQKKITGSLKALFNPATL